MRKVIVNTTPLIALCHVRKLDVLQKMYGEITIPQAVYQELSVKEESICKKMVDDALDWIHVEDIENQMAKLVFKTQLHDGEVEVMILAKEKNADVVRMSAIDAVNDAVDRCINDGIMADFLIKHKAEVRNVCITEFDEKVYNDGIREEGREEGIRAIIEMCQV